MTKQVQVKNYVIVLAKKPFTSRVKFEVETRAVSEKDAIKKALSRIGSKHSVPSQLLQIKSITEIPDDALSSPILRELALNDDVKI